MHILCWLTLGVLTKSRYELSDRVGRVRIMAISALSGAMVCVISPHEVLRSDTGLSDIVFVAVVRNSDQFPGGYHLLVVSNMIDGLLGGKHWASFRCSTFFFLLSCFCYVGFSTAVATSHAYVSDCVAPTERWVHSISTSPW